MDYNSNSSVGFNSGGLVGTSTLTATAQRAKEIPAKLEMIDKLLHELLEEALGMNGTFASVLAVAPGAQTNGSAKPPQSTPLADTLDSFAVRIQQATSTLRDIRSRCEL